MAKQIEWTIEAQNNRLSIFEYLDNRNKSKQYSKKLNRIFNENIKFLSHYPLIGRKFGNNNIRIRIVKDYFIVYQVDEQLILILSIWDSRQNPKKIEHFL